MNNSLTKDTILNGANAIGVFKQDGIVYRVEPVPVFTEIVIHGFQQGVTRVVSIGDYVTNTYQVVAVSVDTPYDEGSSPGATSTSGTDEDTRAGVRVFKHGVPVFNTYLRTSNMAKYEPNLIVRPGYMWHVTPDNKIKSITLRCKLIYFDEQIVIP